jgi:hypothetical protein
MFNFVKTVLGLIGGASSLYSIVATVVIGGGTVWYYYDKYITTPIETAQKATEKCYTDANETIAINEEALRQAGVLISEQSQTIYDMEHNRTEQLIDDDIALIECQSQVEKLEWRIKHEKFNTSDEFFYTKLPF